MKIKKQILTTFLSFLMMSVICFGQTKTSNKSESKTINEMKQFFYKLDDDFNLAMTNKDSLFFVNTFADSFINCTPLGEINSKSAEISTLLNLPFTHVERVALKYDIFTYSDKIATMSVTKKITRKDSSIIYVRRSIVYQFVEGKWLIASGQGTSVLPKYID
jgi:hypothetical protein